MKTPLSLLSGSPKLTHSLTAAFVGDEGPRPVKVRHRKRPRSRCAFPNEMVTCRHEHRRMVAERLR
jgi:hypothetical protein